MASGHGAPGAAAASLRRHTAGFAAGRHIASPTVPPGRPRENWLVPCTCLAGPGHDCCPAVPAPAAACTVPTAAAARVFRATGRARTAGRAAAVLRQQCGRLRCCDIKGAAPAPSAPLAPAAAAADACAAAAAALAPAAAAAIAPPASVSTRLLLHALRSRCCRPLPCSSSCSSCSVHADRLRHAHLQLPSQEAAKHLLTGSRSKVGSTNAGGAAPAPAASS